MEQIVLLLRNGGDPSRLDNTMMNDYNVSTGQGKVQLRCNEKQTLFLSPLLSSTSRPRA